MDKVLYGRQQVTGAEDWGGNTRWEGQRKQCSGYMPGVFTHLPSERKEMVCVSEHSQSTFLQNTKLYDIQNHTPKKARWSGLCSKTVVCKIVRGHLPFLLIRKIENQKLSFPLQRSYLLLAAASSSCQETRRRELAVLSLCWKSCVHCAISNSVTHDWGDAIQ